MKPVIYCRENQRGTDTFYLERAAGAVTIKIRTKAERIVASNFAKQRFLRKNPESLAASRFFALHLFRMHTVHSSTA